MSSRKIQSPGIEINEIDRSQYGKVDYSLPNSPTSLIVGFASKGEDYSLQWINSKQTLDDTYGQPENEFERYFYNAQYEILNRGGTCIAAKLPYANASKDQYNYVDFFLKFKTLSEETGTSNAQTSTDQINSQTAIDSEIDQSSAEYGENGILDVDLGPLVDNPILEVLNANDSSLTSCIEVKTQPSKIQFDQLLYGGCSPMSRLDQLLTKEAKVPTRTIRVYDITRSQYKKFDTSRQSIVSADFGDGNVDKFSNDFLGIVPVVVTPANALFFQNMLDFGAVDSSLGILPECFNSARTFVSQRNDHVKLDFNSIYNYLVMPIQSTADVDDDTPSRMRWTSQESVSRRAALAFPLINYDSYGHFQQDSMKKIGIVVFKAFKDTDNNGKVNFQLLESFVGSLDPTARDPITKANVFIDDVVNASSQFIRVFSNANLTELKNASTITMSQQPLVSLGFYKVDCRKKINYSNSIVQPLTRILENAQNPYTLPLDLVVDAGMSNIANIAYSFGGVIDVDKMPLVSNFSSQKVDSWKMLSSVDVAGWKAVLKKLDDFCKYTRRDCMLLADGLRQFCLEGDAKIVRKTAPYNTVSNAILPKLKYMSNVLESSYSAGYCNWFYGQDRSSSDYMWFPPSIKASGVYIYCDTYFQPWSAPAGMTRGILRDVVDVAFTPNEDEAGKIYNAQWNYAMNYPIDGVVVEGHKTFQTQRTALDRVNVRRLLLYLEKRTARLARRFVYEGNTPYLRQTFVDMIKPIYEDAVHRDGLREYAIKCDDELNTPQVIENNELRCRIAVKPVKTVDFIVIDLIATRQSASVTEEVLR